MEIFKTRASIPFASAIKPYTFPLCGIFAGAAAIASCIAAYLDFDTASNLLVFGGYYAVAASFLTWLAVVINNRGHDNVNAARWCRDNVLGLAVSAVIIGVIFYSVEPGYRVLSDETNLVAVSRSMTFDKNVFNTTMTRWGFEHFQDIENLLPTRPLLYPFLVSVVHSTLGYTYRNAFYTNGLFAWLVFVLVFATFRPKLGSYRALALVFLCASLPLFSLAATSAGFEMLNLLMLMVLLVTLYRYADHATDRRLIEVCYTIALFSHVRYENPLIGAAALLCVWPRFSIAQWRRVWPHFGFIAVLLAPRFWQAITSAGQMENGAQDLLNITRVPQRTWNFLTGLVDPTLHYPYAPLTTALVVIGCLYGLWHWRSQVWTPASKMVAAAAVIATLIYFLITSSHFLADPLHPSVSRLYMLPNVILIAILIPGLASLPSSLRMTSLLVAMAAFNFANSVAMEKRQTNTLTLIRKTKNIYDFLNRNQPDERDIIIVDRPGQYTVIPMGAVSPDWANGNWKNLYNDVQRGYIPRLFLVQDELYHDKSLHPPTPKDFNVTRLLRLQNEAGIAIVISQLTVAP